MSNQVTYSPAYTIVPTYECFNRCSYCNFRVDVGQDTWLSLEKAAQILKKLQGTEISEILILSGEVHPDSSRRKQWFDRIWNICQLALDLGFLPHTNAGPLSRDEMRHLKEVNVSMGLMLEQLTPELLKTVHKHAPSKQPEVRHQQLVWAGELKIPFTTGLLLGIGENEQDRIDSLKAIADIQNQYGHIQEVILQPHSQGDRQSYKNENFPLDYLISLILQAREILPETTVIQIPPNLLSEPKLLLACLEAGASDLGGISPRDEVNPDYPHLNSDYLRAILEPAGWELVKRLPVYPQYYNWLIPGLQQKVRSHRAKLKKIA